MNNFLSASDQSVTAVLTSSPVMGVSPKAENSKLAYSLVTLKQATASFGLTAKETHAAAQSLYEKGLITYWYVEEQEIPASMFKGYSEVAASCNCLTGKFDYDPKFKGPVWVADYQQAHMGIIPTLVAAAAVFGAKMSREEGIIYGLIQQRLLDLFRPS